MRRQWRRWTVFVTAVAAVVAIGCAGEGDPGCICTADFKIMTVVVVDDANNAVEGMAIEVTLLRTSELLDVDQTQGLPPGVYAILTDSEKDKISLDGDRIRVAGTKQGSSFSAEFDVFVGVCRCHVSKLSGPDTVAAVSTP